MVAHPRANHNSTVRAVGRLDSRAGFDSTKQANHIACSGVLCLLIARSEVRVLEDEMKRSSSEHFSRRKILASGGALVAIAVAAPVRRAAADLPAPMAE